MESGALNTVESELIDMIREADTEENGLIDFPEFVSVLARKSIPIDENAIDGLFKVFSTNTTQPDLIDAKSLASVLHDVGEGFSEAEIENLIGKARLHAEETSDGRPAISRADFAEIIKSIDINHIKIDKITKSVKK